MEPDRFLAGHRPVDQPVIDRVDTLLWQVLRHEAEGVHAPRERKGRQLGKTKIQELASQRDESDKGAE